jgi:peptidyl-prolyl cis-trans isomerase A (cyclophilin A)
MKQLLNPVLWLMVMALTACGGLDQNKITVDRLMYDSVSNFTISGPNLDKGITVLAPKCTGLKELTESGATERIYSCTPSVIGPITVTVIGGNSILHTASFNIPNPQVTMTTSFGKVVMELDPTAAPLSVKNFLKYVNKDFYTNLIFHRVIAGFVIQAGAFNADLAASPTDAPIKLEVKNGLSNLRGTVAMARTSELDSATSQFYINLVDNVTLDTVNGGYAVFGSVRAGLEAVDAIGVVPTATTANGVPDVPIVPVVINSIVQTQ